MANVEKAAENDKTASTGAVEPSNIDLKLSETINSLEANKITPSVEMIAKAEKFKDDGNQAFKGLISF